MKKSVIIYIFLLVFVSCSKQDLDIPVGVAKALKQAGKNSVELEKVIDHYKGKSDTLGLKAAYYLIENMPEKYAMFPKDNSDKYKQALHSLPDDPVSWDPALSKVYQYFDSVAVLQKIPEEYKVYDLDVITADYLIQNIDLAFEAWRRYKKSSLYTFEDFCNYVLPYRDGDEPLDNWRKEGFNKFGSLLDSLSSPLEIAKYIIPNLKVYYNVGMSKYPYPLSFEEIKYTGRGSCEHLSFYLTQSLRAIGIPAASEIIPAWANRSSGHRWNVVKDTTGLFVDIGFGPDAVNNVQYKISKIYRQVYQIQPDYIEKYAGMRPVFNHPDWKDITFEYDMPLSDVCISSDRKVRIAYLCTFDNRNWVPVMRSKKEDSCFLFKSLARGDLFGKNRITEYEQEGKGIVYLPMAISGFRLRAIAAPFILQEDGVLKFLEPDHLQCRSVSVYRKYPLYDYIAGYIKQMKGGDFEVSNTPDFSKKEIIHRISETPSSVITEIKVLPSSVYRYIRYVAPDSCLLNIGELRFFTNEGEVNGTPFTSQETNSASIWKAFDGNIETYYTGGKLGDFIGLDMRRKLKISKISYSPRTDNNGVFPGDEYELFYWEDGWKSLGKKVADDYKIMYDNVPENALLLLHDHTRGKEDRIFTYEDDRQIWW